MSTVDPVEPFVDTGGGEVSELPVLDTGGCKVICDGLLCSILHSMSHFPNKEEFVSVIERKSDEAEILDARKRLFTYFSDVCCSQQKKPILQIKRGSVKKNIEDIVDQLIKIDRSDISSLFFMPWNYVIKSFKCDGEVRSEMIEEDVCTNVDVKIDSLKSEMNLKNQALCELIHTKFNEVMQLVGAKTTYANATAKTGQAQPLAAQLNSSARDAHVFKQPTAPDNRGRSIQPRLQNDQGRDRSNSKRRRGDDGSIIYDQPPNQKEPNKDRSQSQGRQKKHIVGTASNTGRKMRAPPADIFVYGVHPETSIYDIVQDLAVHDVIIESKDIVVKSNKEAFLKSYKISVKAEDLEKALSPCVWPLRVKVREFIHYSRKNGQGNTEKRNSSEGQDGHVMQVQSQRNQRREESGERGPSLTPTSNRYSALDDDQSINV